MNTNVHARRSAIVSFRHVALSIAVAFFAFLQVRPASADPGDGFAGFYQIVSMTPFDDETTTVTIRLRVQNVSGRTVDNAVMWLLDDAPGATIGWFPGSLVLGDRATANVEGSFVVPTQTAQRWRTAPGPAFEAAYTDGEGREQRCPIDAIRARVAGEARP